MSCIFGGGQCPSGHGIHEMWFKHMRLSHDIHGVRSRNPGVKSGHDEAIFHIRPGSTLFRSLLEVFYSRTVALFGPIRLSPYRFVI